VIDEFIPENGASFPFTKKARQSLEPSQFPVQWKKEYLSPGVKQPSSETFSSLPSISELKNERRYRFAPFYDFTLYTRTTFLYFTLLLSACDPHPYKFSETFTMHYFRFEYSPFCTTAFHNWCSFEMQFQQLYLFGFFHLISSPRLLTWTLHMWWPIFDAYVCFYLKPSFSVHFFEGKKNDIKKICCASSKNFITLLFPYFRSATQSYEN